MELKDFVIGLFEKGKDPEKFEHVKRLKKLEDIPDHSVMYLVNRETFTVSSYKIDKFFPIDKNWGGIVEGDHKIGVYSREEYHLSYESKINNRDGIKITQKELDEEELYLFYPFEDLFSK